jgi:hypothetical protein
MRESVERIYSTTQLVEALQSGVTGLKDQLQVVIDASLHDACHGRLIPFTLK